MGTVTRWAILIAVVATGCCDRSLNSVSGVLKLGPEAVDFGATAMGREKSAMVEVRNDGNAQLRIESLASPIHGIEVSQGEPFTLAVGERRMLQVRCKPEVEGLIEGLIELIEQWINDGMRRN